MYTVTRIFYLTSHSCVPSHTLDTRTLPFAAPAVVSLKLYGTASLLPLGGIGISRRMGRPSWVPGVLPAGRHHAVAVSITMEVLWTSLRLPHSFILDAVATTAMTTALLDRTSTGQPDSYDDYDYACHSSQQLRRPRLHLSLVIDFWPEPTPAALSTTLQSRQLLLKNTSGMKGDFLRSMVALAKSMLTCHGENFFSLVQRG
jgi:hypothetical protein